MTTVVLPEEFGSISAATRADKGKGNKEMTEPTSHCLYFHRQTPADCEGDVELRDALSPTGIQYKWCAKHWDERLRKQQDLRQAYPDSPHPPEWFDPTAAGERWDDDY